MVLSIPEGIWLLCPSGMTYMIVIWNLWADIYFWIVNSKGSCSALSISSTFPIFIKQSYYYMSMLAGQKEHILILHVPNLFFDIATVAAQIEKQS
jgi:hypothetical protein